MYLIKNKYIYIYLIWYGKLYNNICNLSMQGNRLYLFSSQCSYIDVDFHIHFDVLMTEFRDTR